MPRTKHTAPVSLAYELRFAFGDASDAVRFTVTDTGDPAGTPGNATTTAPATVTVQTPAGSAGVARVGGGAGADTIVVTHGNAGQDLQVTLNGTNLSAGISLASVTGVRAWARGGDDTLSLIDLAVTSHFDGGDSIDSFTLDGTSGADTMSVAHNAVTFNARLVGRAAVESLTVNGQGGDDAFAVVTTGALSATINGGPGTDTLTGAERNNAWAVGATGSSNAGTLNSTLAFATVESLAGGSGDDAFVFSNGRSVGGSVAGGGGSDTLDYAAYTTAVTYNLATGLATGTLLGATGIESLVGGSATADTLIGANAANAWSLTGNNAGSLNATLSYSAVENLTGGTAADTFTVAGPGRVSGAVNGAAGDDTLVGPDDANAWSVSTTDNAGALDGQAFANVENLTGGSGDDTFTFGAGRAVLGVVAGGGGTDTLNYAAYATGVTVDLIAGAATGTGGISGLEAIVGGGAATDTLVGAGTFRLTGGRSGTLNAVFAYSSVENLSGGAGDDTFAFAGGSVPGTVSGGDGVDTLDYAEAGGGVNVTVNLQALTATRTGGIAAVEALVGGAAATTLAGPDAVNAWALTGDGAGALNGVFTFSAVDVVTGGASSDTFTVAAAAAPAVTVQGAGGPDTLVGNDGDNTWTVTGSGAGNLQGVLSFTGVENLTGGAGADTFKLNAGAISGTVDGGAGADRLDYAERATAASVNLQTLSATGAGLFARVESFVGGAQADTLTGANVANTWSLTGADAGTVGGFAFASFENLTGGTASDVYVFNPGASVGGTVNGRGGSDTLDYSAFGAAVTVNLGLGAATAAAAITGVESLVGSAFSDTLVGDNATRTWSITGANAGAVAGLAFSGVENLTGGTANDTFRFSDGAGVAGAVTGGGGADRLDYALYSAGVTVNLRAGEATGTGGVTQVADATGGSGDDYLIGSEIANALLGGGGNDVLLGGGGDDTLSGGNGRDLLVGGSGSDVLLGAGADDVLVGGLLGYHDEATGAANRAALDAIMAEWSSSASYATRVARLKGTQPGGLNGAYALDATTVFDDLAADTLTGGAGRDWYLYGLLDVLEGAATNEEQTLV